MWTAIESVNFKDFVQRAATATMYLTEFYAKSTVQTQLDVLRDQLASLTDEIIIKM